MKKIALLLTSLFLMGTAQTTLAQQRKPAAKTSAKTTARKPAAKAPAKKPAVVSIPLEGPATIDGKVAFLGISLAETAPAMKSKLLAKGLKVEWVDNEDYNIYLKGNIDGTAVRVNISVGQEKKVSSISMIDAKGKRLPQATTRFKSLVTKIEAIYGKGQYETNESEYKIYKIPVEGGEVSINLFNEDEMDGASDFYTILVNFS